MGNPVFNRIVSQWTNTTLKRVVCVYQLHFAGFKPPGFGDFLRGCFSMMQMIATLNKFCGAHIEFDIDIRNHPIGVHVSGGRFYPTPYGTVGDFKIDLLLAKLSKNDPQFQHNLGAIIQAMNPIQDEVFYTFCCKYEPYATIKEEDRDFLRSRLHPSEDMREYMDEALEELGLVKKDYSVLHVRCIDADSFPPKQLGADYFARLDALVDANIDPKKRYLILSSNNAVKAHFKGRSQFYMRNSHICHLGTDVDQHADATRDTMLDFFLMSMAKDIIGITPYGVCGFSQECAKLYNIPHTYVKIEDTSGVFTPAHMTPAQRIAYDHLMASGA